MNARRLHGPLRTWVALGLASIVCVGCDTPPKKPSAPPPAVAAPAPPPVAPAPPPPPGPADRQRAQKLAVDAIDLLQRGEESNASGILDQALKLDPANETAKKLVDQIGADAQKELGPTSWKYAIRPGDSLALVAQRFLGDRLRFYILAKYNNLTVPNRIAVGQEIRIPGKEPKIKPPPPKVLTPLPSSPPDDVVAPAPAPAPTPAEPPPVAAPAKPKGDAATVVDPSAKQRSDIARLSRAAETCQSREQIDCAIDNWNKVLDLDPTNEQARLKRDKAISLRNKLKGL